MPSRRQRRHTASLYRAKVFSYFSVDRFTRMAALPPDPKSIVSWMIFRCSNEQSDSPQQFHLATDQWPLLLDPALLRRTAAVMRHRRDVLDGAHIEARGGQSAHRRLASRARPAHLHVHAAHAVIARLIGGVRGRLLRGKRRALT